ncbi:UPF0301 protein YqgE [Buchnera aphidicola (Periphyllus testudinaceus)]
MKNFRNHLLISMPNINNTIFFKTVIYIYQNDKFGTKGIIINKKIKNLKLKKIFEQIKINKKNKNFFKKNKKPILFGGPLEKNKGFIIHKFKKNFLSNIYSSPSISITFSKDILKYLIKKKKYKKTLISLGYCSWEKNQLEYEILNNYWLLTTSNNEILFHTSLKKKWKKSLKKIGITNPYRLNIETGNI